MTKKKYSAEKIIQLLSEVEVHTSDDNTIAQALHQIRVTERLRDEFLDGEISTSL